VGPRLRALCGGDPACVDGALALAAGVVSVLEGIGQWHGHPGDWGLDPDDETVPTSLEAGPSWGDQLSLQRPGSARLPCPFPPHGQHESTLMERPQSVMGSFKAPDRQGSSFARCAQTARTLRPRGRSDPGNARSPEVLSGLWTLDRESSGCRRSFRFPLAGLNFFQVPGVITRSTLFLGGSRSGIPARVPAPCAGCRPGRSIDFHFRARGF